MRKKKKCNCGCDKDKHSAKDKHSDEKRKCVIEKPKRPTKTKEDLVFTDLEKVYYRSRDNVRTFTSTLPKFNSKLNKNGK